MYYSVVLNIALDVLHNVSGRPQIVVYRAPSTHISLVSRNFFCQNVSHLVSLSSLSSLSRRRLSSISHRHLSSQPANTPTTHMTTQQTNNKSTTTRPNNQQ